MPNTAFLMPRHLFGLEYRGQHRTLLDLSIKASGGMSGRPARKNAVFLNIVTCVLKYVYPVGVFRAEESIVDLRLSRQKGSPQ